MNTKIINDKNELKSLHFILTIRKDKWIDKQVNKMIIPVKCFTCGEVLANKYRYYLAEVKKRKQHMGLSTQTEYLTTDLKSKTVEGQVMDELNLTKPCCRRHVLTHVDVL